MSMKNQQLNEISNQFMAFWLKTETSHVVGCATARFSHLDLCAAGSAKYT
jgi:hypothetical protein